MSGRILRALARLFSVALLGSLVLGLLLLGITVALLSVLWSLVRGKRPAMFTVFRTFPQATRTFGRTNSPVNPGEVVDVQAHEVHTALGERTQR